MLTVVVVVVKVVVVVVVVVVVGHRICRVLLDLLRVYILAC